MKHYITLVEKRTPVGPHSETLMRLTYEITPLREGMERWFLVAVEPIS
jgi:hypothetical protein